MYLLVMTDLAILLGWPVINNIRGGIMAKNQYKGNTKSESAFVRGRNQARRRAEARDRQRQMIEGEKVRTEAKRRQKSKRKK